MKKFILLGFFAAVMSVNAAGQEAYPTAILGFETRGTGSPSGDSAIVPDLVMEKLSEEDGLILLEREQINKILREHEITASGLVDSSQGVRIGKMLGAKIIITGAITELDTSTYLTARIIGVETSRVLAASVKGNAAADYAELSEKLGAKIAKKINDNGSKLVAPEVSKEDRLAALKKVLGNKKRPSIFVDTAERHIGMEVIDPAIETQLLSLLTKLDFTVYNDLKDASKADIKLTGEGFSEFAMRMGNLISVKARVELKAVDAKTGAVIDADKAVVTEINASEQIAGKLGLERATMDIAERLIPKLVK